MDGKILTKTKALFVKLVVMEQYGPDGIVRWRSHNEVHLWKQSVIK